MNWRTIDKEEFDRITQAENVERAYIGGYSSVHCRFRHWRDVSTGQLVAKEEVVLDKSEYFAAEPAFEDSK